MTDGESITQLMHLYALAIDTKQWQLFDRVFVPDCEIDFVGQKWHSLDAWREDWDQVHRKYAATQHVVTNVSWHLTGDTGNALSYGRFHLIVRGEAQGGENIYAKAFAADTEPASFMVTGGAWYDDEIRRTDAGWRVTSRICGVTWVNGDVGVPEFDFLTANLTSMSNGVRDGTLRFVGALES